MHASLTFMCNNTHRELASHSHWLLAVAVPCCVETSWPLPLSVCLPACHWSFGNSYSGRDEFGWIEGGQFVGSRHSIPGSTLCYHPSVSARLLPHNWATVIRLCTLFLVLRCLEGLAQLFTVFVRLIYSVLSYFTASF